MKNNTVMENVHKEMTGSIDHRTENNSWKKRQPLAERFCGYIEEERRLGRFSSRKFRDMAALAGKLGRYLAVRGCPELTPQQFTAEMLADFETFCIDEHIYANDPAYASVYPRDYAGSRRWPKRKLKEEPLRKLLSHFHSFWNDLVLFGEIGKSPYGGYEPLPREKKQHRWSEMPGEQLTLDAEEFRKLISTPVPQRLAEVRNAFILQICTGCRGEDFRRLTMDDVAVSATGIPYIRYIPVSAQNETIVPLVRIAFDIMMRTRFRFFLGTQNASYNRRIRELLRFCGITRPVCLYDNRTGRSSLVPLCDAATQSTARKTHLTMLGKEPRTLEDRFNDFSKSMSQKPFRTDCNLHITEGLPFTPQDPLIYEEQPEKLPGGRTNPYLISRLTPVSGQVNLHVRHAHALEKERKVLACSRFIEFVDSLEDALRQCVQYGILLLKKIGDFHVTFVEDCGETLHILKSATRNISCHIYFYIDIDNIVLLHGCLEREPGAPAARELRWRHVTGGIVAQDYDAVLNGKFGSPGTARRELGEMQACSCYVSQALRKARIDKGFSQEEVFSQWGLKSGCGNLAHAENGTRVLPFKYLSRLLAALELNATVVRPSCAGWNRLSRTHTMEQMLSL